MDKSTFLPQTGLIRLPTILQHFQISRSGWYAGIQAGLYPPPTKVGSKSFWRAEDIRQLLEKLGGVQGQNHAV